VGSNPSTVYWIDVSSLLAITLKKKLKKKVAKSGTKKYGKSLIFITGSWSIKFQTWQFFLKLKAKLRG
jgi:hypothetical protein